MTIGSDFDALIAKAARLSLEQSPEHRAAQCRQKRRYEIQGAAYKGSPEHQAAMKAAKSSGDAELFAIEVGLAERRAEAALIAFDAVEGGI